MRREPSREEVEETVRPAGDRAPGTAVRIVLYNALSAAVIIGAWQVATWLYASVFFPSPLDVLRAFVSLALHGDVLGNSLLLHMGRSLVRVAAGFGLGVVSGVPLGLLMGLYPPLYQRTRVAIEPFRFISPVAWIPLTIVLLSGFSRYVFLIWLGAFFPIFVATLVGVPRVEPIHRHVAKVHGAGRGYIVRRVVIPSVLPDILGGMRVGMGNAWMTIVAAEMSGSETTGLGRLMVNYAELIRIPEIVVGMILIAVLGFAMNEGLLRAERHLFRWRWEVRL